MSVLLEQGHSQSAVARLLDVSEGTVRYHRKRMASGARDGRSNQVSKAEAFADVISEWHAQQADGRINLAGLHDWLCCEHGYTGSLKSVQRYWKRTYPAPKVTFSLSLVSSVAISAFISANEKNRRLRNCAEICAEVGDA